MTEHLVYEQKIDLPYRYTVGEAHRAFLRGLAERRIMASRAETGELYVPARPFAPDGCRLAEVVEVEPRGTLVAATVARHLPGEPVFGLIRLGGSASLMLHRLGDGAELLPPGAEVEPVWDETAGASILAISHFRPLR